MIGSVSANATNYYISFSVGIDSNNGLSAATPLQTLSKVSATTFSAGDSILFKAGDTWSGQLAPLGSGSSAAPIVIDMYGSGSKPVINGIGADLSTAFSLNNQSYWEINNLELTNQQLAGRTARLLGMSVTTSDQMVGIKHIYIRNCYVHDIGSLTDESNSDFSKSTGGIIFSGYTNDVLIKGCHIKNVSVEGIRNSSSIECSHFIIDSNLLENIYGDGIVLHGVKDGSAITHNTARNTCHNTSSANYAGIWTYLSESTTIAYNEVSGITGGGVYDGESFDADISTNGDIFEYNYSHDNKRGFMLFMPSTRNIIVRYNISVNDVGDCVRLFNFTNITDNSNNRIYNNVFYIPNNVTQLFQNTGGGTISFTGDFSNNIVYCTGAITNFGTKAISFASTFYNNCFFPQSMTNVNGPSGTVAGNIYTNPLFINAGYSGDGISGGVQTAYVLSTGSPCINTGYSILNNGGTDFVGTNINNSAYATIGAIWPSDITTWNIAPVKVSADTYTYDKNSTTNYGTSTQLISKFGGCLAPENTSTVNN